MSSNSQTGASLPVGSVLAFAGNETNLPQLEGWLPCDGRELKNQVFKDYLAPFATRMVATATKPLDWIRSPSSKLLL